MRMLHAFWARTSITENSHASEHANVSNRVHRIFGLRQKTGTPSCGRELDAASFRMHISFGYEIVDRIDGVKRRMPDMRHARHTTVGNRHLRIAGRLIGYHRRNSPGHTDAMEDNRPVRRPQQASPRCLMIEYTQIEIKIEPLSWSSPLEIAPDRSLKLKPPWPLNSPDYLLYQNNQSAQTIAWSTVKCENQRARSG